MDGLESPVLRADVSRVWVERDMEICLVLLIACCSAITFTVDVMTVHYLAIFMFVWAKLPVYEVGNVESELWWAAGTAVTAVAFLFAVALVILTWILVVVVSQTLRRVESKKMSRRCTVVKDHSSTLRPYVRRQFEKSIFSLEALLG